MLRRLTYTYRVFTSALIILGGNPLVYFSVVTMKESPPMLNLLSKVAQEHFRVLTLPTCKTLTLNFLKVQRLHPLSHYCFCNIRVKLIIVPMIFINYKLVNVVYSLADRTILLKIVRNGTNFKI